MDPVDLLRAIPCRFCTGGTAFQGRKVVLHLCRDRAEERSVNCLQPSASPQNKPSSKHKKNIYNQPPSWTDKSISSCFVIVVSVGSLLAMADATWNYFKSCRYCCGQDQKHVFCAHMLFAEWARRGPNTSLDHHFFDVLSNAKCPRDVCTSSTL